MFALKVYSKSFCVLESLSQIVSHWDRRTRLWMPLFTDGAPHFSKTNILVIFGPPYYYNVDIYLDFLFLFWHCDCVSKVCGLGLFPRVFILGKSIFISIPKRDLLHIVFPWLIFFLHLKCGSISPPTYPYTYLSDMSERIKANPSL